MSREDIEPRRWSEFCDQFSRLHHGWQVTVGVIDTHLLDTAEEVQAHALTEAATFQGISVEREPSTPGLVILVGDGTGHYAHEIRRPEFVVFETTADGAHKGLRIDDAEGHSTLLRFRTPARPEEANGIAPAER